MPSERRAQFRLTLLGPWDLRGPDGRKVRSVLAQPKRLCLLAYLALSGEPVSRSTLVALFWPESDEERARNALSQSLHYLRRSLNAKAVESVEGDRVVVPPKRVWFDARELLRPRPEGDAGSADSSGGDDGARGTSRRDRADLAELARPILRGREFFQGWNAEDSQPLQQWLDGVRRRVRERAAEIRAEARGDVDAPETVDPSRAEREAATQTAGADPGVEGERGRGGLRGIPSVIRWLVGGLALGTLLTVGLLRASGFGPAVEGGASPPDGAGVVRSVAVAPAVAVLMPRVLMLDQEPLVPADALARAVHDEVVTRMESLTETEIVSIGFEEEVWQLVRSLRAQGANEVPALVLSIRIRTGGQQARVIGLLLRGPDYTEILATSEGDYPVPDHAAGLIELPRVIAADLVEGVRGVVARDLNGQH